LWPSGTEKRRLEARRVRFETEELEDRVILGLASSRLGVAFWPDGPLVSSPSATPAHVVRV
jgi:hypothetical protein